MGQRLLVGLGAALLVLASLLVSLSLAGAAGAGSGPDGTVLPRTLATPVSGACLPGAQQCNPVVPQPAGGVTPGVLLAATLVPAALAIAGRGRIRLPRRAVHLPRGFVPVLLRPPQSGLGTI